MEVYALADRSTLEIGLKDISFIYILRLIIT